MASNRKEDSTEDGDEDIRTETDASSALDVDSPIPDVDEVNRIKIFVHILQGQRFFARSGGK